MHSSLLSDPIIAWRALLLYGNPPDTTRLAFMSALTQFAERRQVNIRLADLAEAFLAVYETRLQNDRPQHDVPERPHAMERLVRDLVKSYISRDMASERTATELVTNVLPTVQSLFGTTLPKPFWLPGKNGGIQLTDSALQIVRSKKFARIRDESDARWSLLEETFAVVRDGGRLINNARSFLLDRDDRYQPITSLISVLFGYQEGRCFHCGDLLVEGDAQVDHVFPLHVVLHDQLWSLAAVHESCIVRRADNAPPARIAEQLVGRNEVIIASGRPLREMISVRTGRTPLRRRQFIQQVHREVTAVVPWEWEGLAGYEPNMSAFYHHLAHSA